MKVESQQLELRVKGFGLASALLMFDPREKETYFILLKTNPQFSVQVKLSFTFRHQFKGNLFCL